MDEEDSKSRREKLDFFLISTVQLQLLWLERREFKLETNKHNDAAFIGNDELDQNLMMMMICGVLFFFKKKEIKKLRPNDFERPIWRMERCSNMVGGFFYPAKRSIGLIYQNTLTLKHTHTHSRTLRRPYFAEDLCCGFQWTQEAGRYKWRWRIRGGSVRFV